jgi:hypothetical protein
MSYVQRSSQKRLIYRIGKVGRQAGRQPPQTVLEEKAAAVADHV